jgi:membrane-associated phospholipid phosphatase
MIRSPSLRAGARRILPGGAVLQRIGAVLGPSEDPGAVRIRRTVAVLFLVYGAVLVSTRLREGSPPTMMQTILVMFAIAVFVGRGGRFVRDLLPIAMGLISYGLMTTYAQKLSLGVHYVPQIRVEKALALGTVPTVWLQSHLYSGGTGPLEVFAVLMWLSHFVVPLLLGFVLWLKGRRSAFAVLMCGLLGALVLGEITFVLAPTAPPWLAAEHGYLPHVHHLLKQSLAGMHLSGIAKIDGDPRHYNIVAALPSLHAAFPLLSLLVARRFGLPRWLQWALVFQIVGVAFAIVYTGEHYLVDVLAGLLYAFVVFRLITALLERRPGRTSQED